MTIAQSNELNFPVYQVKDKDDFQAKIEVIPADKTASLFEENVSDLDQQYADLLKKVDVIDDKLDKVTCHADKIDYALAASSGIITGLIDIFLVGAPGESKLQNWSDQVTENAVKKFAQAKGWKGEKANSAISFLEEKFKVGYDFRGAGDAAQGLTSPSIHHFDSLAHHPTLMGLVFSIIDQFSNSATFITVVSDELVNTGDLIKLQSDGRGNKLVGGNTVAKIFCGCVNWFGHLMSDVSGSSSSIGRGAGIPGPFLALANETSALLRTMHIPANKFEKEYLGLAKKMFRQGFDARFEAAQAIPVIINELLIRLMYSIRRTKKYLKEHAGNFELSSFWKAVVPFGNATIQRMLLVGEAVFTVMDVADAAIRSGGDILALCLRINVVGVGRLLLSVGGELTYGVRRAHLRNKRIVVMQQLITTKQAVVEYKLADAWHEIPQTLATLEKAELAINQAWQTSQKVYLDYDQNIRPALSESINKLDEEVKRGFLDILD